MICMYNIAVMGDRDSIYGFGALGMEIFPTSDEAETKKTFKKLCSGDYAIIYITEAIENVLAEEIEKVKESYLPAVILIPGISGNTGRGMEKVKEAAARAVGSDIIFNG